MIAVDDDNDGRRNTDALAKRLLQRGLKEVSFTVVGKFFGAAA
jgi:hypothetical protein